VLAKLTQDTIESGRDVFEAEIPQNFRHLFTDERSVAPRVEYASGLDGDNPKCVVSIIGCTGDWFGGWDGLTPGSVDRFITPDLKAGRLPEVIARDEPAILVCHWPGIYYNGREIGFDIFKEVVRRLNAGYHHLIWMKLSEIACYWAARELTRVDRQGSCLVLRAPFATTRFTLRIPGRPSQTPALAAGGVTTPLEETRTKPWLKSGRWHQEDDAVIVCFDLPKGASTLTI
jgi:hypothetical protein